MALVRIRESFAAKLLSALLGTVGLLLLVTLVVVRAETARQVEAATERAIESAGTQFAELDALQQQLTAQLARPFTEGPRAVAALEEAFALDSLDYIAGTVEYDLDFAQLEDVVVAFTDGWGEHVLTLDRGARIEDADPLEVSSLAMELLEGTEYELRSFRALHERLYSVRTQIVGFDRPIGTVSFGLPVDDADLARIGALVGVEVCIVAGGACVAGTAVARASLAPALVAREGTMEPIEVRAAGQQWSIRAAPLVPAEPEQGWRVVAVPLDAVLAPFRRITRALFVGGGAALALSLLVGTVLSRGLTRPVRQLVEATGRVARGDFEGEVVVDSRDELRTLGDAFNDMTRGLLLKERYRSVLNKVVSRDVAEELLKGDVELGGENRRITVLFADIRGFTSLTEGMEPQEVIALLNECMERLSAAVEEERGVVDKYVGDELMAVFGAPLSQGDEALRAVRAAVRMRAAIEELNAERADRGEAPIGLGIGLNSGEAVAGNMGSRERLNYTVLGETVNLASRLCSVARPGQILASRETLEEGGDAVRASSAGARTLKGFSEDVEVFAIEGLGDTARIGLARGPGSATAVLALGCGLLALGGPSAAHAQEWPTLSGLGVGYMSPSGRVQVDLSGQLDLEAFWFNGHEAGLAYNADGGLLIAPRLRVFNDIFVGRSLYGLIELRAHAGEAPTNDTFEAKIEQAFVRAANELGTISLQAGRFVSPVGSYGSRHLSEVDPFVRPPLPYDRRTVMSAVAAPADAAAWLTWKDLPDASGLGARVPPVWNAPYMWGAMLAGQIDWLGYRLAVQHGAPSFEDDWWDWLDNVFTTPSWIAGVSASLAPELSIGASYNVGPYGDQILETSPNWGTAGDWREYDQELVTFDVTFARGPLIARAEALRDRWEVPNVGDAVDWSYTAEAQVDVLAGVFVAGRWGHIDFRPVGDGAGGEQEWDYDVTRWEGGVGYRLARNAGLLASAFTNVEATGGAHEDDLLALRLWWAF